MKVNTKEWGELLKKLILIYTYVFIYFMSHIVFVLYSEQYFSYVCVSISQHI